MSHHTHSLSWFVGLVTSLVAMIGGLWHSATHFFLSTSPDAVASGTIGLWVAIAGAITATGTVIGGMGKIWLDDRRDRRIHEFRLRELERASANIPRNTVSAAVASAKADAAASLARHATAVKRLGKLLLVEDDPTDAAYLARLLVKSGFDVRESDSVAGAIYVLEDSTEPFVGAVLDLTLPDGTGMDVVDYCRERGRKVRIVVLTGYASTETTQALKDKGVVAVLEKPLRSADPIVMAIAGVPAENTEDEEKEKGP